MNTDALTAGDIDAIPAGRELDALIAEKVFGVTIIEQTDSNLIFYDYRARLNKEPFTVKHYSNDIAAAWEVVNEMHRKGYWIVLYDYIIQNHDKPYQFVFSRNGQQSASNSSSVELAVCLSALKAVLAK